MERTSRELVRDTLEFKTPTEESPVSFGPCPGQTSITMTPCKNPGRLHLGLCRPSDRL